MADESNKVLAEPREKFGKGAARKLRAVGKIPAVVYGHGTEPVHVTLPAHQITLLLRKANAVLDLDLSGKSQLVLVKDVQKNPVLQIIEHIDLIIVRQGEKVHVEIPVHTTGESAAGTVADIDSKTLNLEVEATHIPENLVVDIEGFEEGTQIFAKDVTLPRGATLISEPDLLVINVHGEKTTSAEEEEAEEAAEAEAASGEAAAGEESAEAAE
jgi:large subunit ribosomal protein L25